MAFVEFCAIAALVIAVIRLYSRVNELETRLASLAFKRAPDTQHAEPARLVSRPEHPHSEQPAGAPFNRDRAEPAQAPAVRTSYAVATATVASPRFAPSVEPRAPQPVKARRAAAAALPGLESPPALGERIRSFFSDDEWEALVGGSVLNKAGAVVLVIGIALFLAYSWTHMTATGRALLSFGISAVMLGAGIWTERKAQYRTFARGLIGAGWAALYATTYAIWAIPATQILPDPFAGSLALLVVAGGIIAHSLVYRSQSATSVAYASAFAALAATPSSVFSVAALLPLAISLLFIAAKFEWYSMALGGLATTWAVLLFKHDTGASLFAAQAVIAACWVLFEAFDLLRVRRRAHGGGVEWIYPLNLAALAGMSYLNWAPHHAHRLWIACAAGAGLFLLDSVVRAYLLPPSAIEDRPFADRLTEGGFEASSLVSVVLAGLAISARAPGVLAAAGLAIEAEAVWLLGIALRSQFLEILGAAGFLWSLVRVPFTPDSYGTSTVLGFTIRNWTPVAILHAFLFYLNRSLRHRTAFSYAAAALVTCVLMAEAPVDWPGTLAVIYGLALFEIALRRRARDFRWQAYGLMFAGTVLAAVENGTAAHPHVFPVVIAFTAMYVCALRSRGLEVPEQFEFAWGSAGAAALLAIVLASIAAPAGFAAAGVCAVSVVLLELGAAGLPERLAHFGVAVLFFGAWFLFVDKGIPVKHPEAAVWLSYAIAAAAGFMAMTRWVLRPPEQVVESEIAVMRGASCAIGMVAAFTAIWTVGPDPVVTPLWAIVTVLLVEFGMARGADAPRFTGLAAAFIIAARALNTDTWNTPWSMIAAVAALYWLCRRFEDPVRRLLFWVAPAVVVFFLGGVVNGDNAAAGWALMAVVLAAIDRRWGLRDAARQASIVAAIAFAAAFFTDMGATPNTFVLIIVAASLFAAQALTASSAGRTYYSVLGTLLIAATLFSEVSGGLLTVSWALEGVALLSCGFALRERVLRLEGLALLFVCILKVFVYDLRNLETLYRILSFIALGVILLAVSWIYTRFHEHLRRLL